MADCSISHHWLQFFHPLSLSLAYRICVSCVSYCVAVNESVSIISIFKNIRLSGCFAFQYQVSYFVGKSMFNVDCLWLCLFPYFGCKLIVAFVFFKKKVEKENYDFVNCWQFMSMFICRFWFYLQNYIWKLSIINTLEILLDDTHNSIAFLNKFIFNIRFWISNQCQ